MPSALVLWIRQSPSSHLSAILCHAANRRPCHLCIDSLTHIYLLVKLKPVCTGKSNQSIHAYRQQPTIIRAWPKKGMYWKSGPLSPFYWFDCRRNLSSPASGTNYLYLALLGTIPSRSTPRFDHYDTTLDAIPHITDCDQTELSR